MTSYSRGSDNKHRPAVFTCACGICQICGLDIVALAERLFPRFPPNIERAYALIDHPWARNACNMADLWQADHINPVFRGGGKVKSPAELRCLCLKCHKEITKQQAGQRARQGKSYKVFE